MKEMTFHDAFVNDMNKKFTENGAVARATTGSKVFDLFSQIGAYRTGSGAENHISTFRSAYAEDPLLTMKLLFYTRDARMGLKEKHTFKVFMNDLCSQGRTDVVIKNLKNFAEFGRWDDLWMLLSYKEIKPHIMKLVKEQIALDSKAERPSLLAKWMPSQNTSSTETRKLASLFMKELNIKPKTYRKLLSLLRERINIVERHMSSNQWARINYEHVPSKASLKYKKAFLKRDEVRYRDFLSKLEKGEAKINAGTLMPYEIVGKYLGYGSKIDQTLEGLWKNLPNTIKENEDSIVVADVSGSMAGMPLNVCISLALYISERNNGCWKDKFITFSNSPKLQVVTGNTLFDRVNCLARAEWHLSTNIEAVFDLILNTAIKNKLSKQKMLKKVYIISDMEFNAASGARNNKTLFQTIKDKYIAAGYEMPLLVFWNVAARNAQFPMAMKDGLFMNVSGASEQICATLFGSEIPDPIVKMKEILNSERYSSVVV